MRLPFRNVLPYIVIVFVAQVWLLGLVHAEDAGKSSAPPVMTTEERQEMQLSIMQVQMNAKDAELQQHRAKEALDTFEKSKVDLQALIVKRTPAGFTMTDEAGKCPDNKTPCFVKATPPASPAAVAPVPLPAPKAEKSPAEKK